MKATKSSDTWVRGHVQGGVHNYIITNQTCNDKYSYLSYRKYLNVTQYNMKDG